jgi:mercuric ion transport protein
MQWFTNKKHLLQFGIAGTILTGICCFTPALVMLLAGAGLAAWLTWLDSLLFPLLVVFVAITAFALAGLVSAGRGGESGDESIQ